MSQLILYSRHGCHLCDVMQADLLALLEEYKCELLLKDTDSRQEWQSKYGHLLPVLETPDGQELCHYHLDEAVVRQWLKSQVQVLCPE